MSAVVQGQAWASTHAGDVATGERQERVVERVEGSFAYLRTAGQARATRVRLRPCAAGVTIPGHRLVSDAP